MRDTIDINIDGQIMTCEVRYNCFIGDDTKDGDPICNLESVFVGGFEVSNLITDKERERVEASLIVTYTNYQHNKWEELRQEMIRLEDYIKE